MQYLIYTDFYRMGGKEISFKDIIKVWLNHNILKGFRIIYFLRHCQYAKDKGKIIRKFWFYKFNSVIEKYNVEISPNSTFGKGFILYHADGIVLHPNVSFGDNCSVLQQVTVGNSNKDRYKVAVIGNNCTLGAGAKIIGPIEIGDNVTIGANAVVTHSIPPNCTCAGAPAKVITENKKNDLYNIDYLSFEDWKGRK